MTLNLYEFKKTLFQRSSKDTGEAAVPTWTIQIQSGTQQGPYPLVKSLQSRPYLSPSNDIWWI